MLCQMLAKSSVYIIYVAQLETVKMGCLQSVDWTTGLIDYHLKCTFRGYNAMRCNGAQDRLGFTDPPINHMGQSTVKMRALVLCLQLVASASTEMIYLLVLVAISIFQPFHQSSLLLQLWAVCWTAMRLETLDYSLSSYQALICNLVDNVLQCCDRESRYHNPRH